MEIFDLDMILPRGWSLVALGIFAAIVFIAIWRRRYFLGYSASTSMVAALAILMLLVATWKTMRRDGLITGFGGKEYVARIASYRGECRFEWETNTGGPMPWPGRLVMLHYPHPKYGLWEADPTFVRGPQILAAFGVQLTFSHADLEHFSADQYSLMVPHWLLILVVCPWFPLIWFHRHRRRRYRARHSLCLACGFDLRGLPADSHVCSECGAPVLPKSPPLAHAQPPSTPPPA